ncbi:MAG: ComF family protein [Candidatus Omnitrophota bacterium]|nr:ComF family protein [Candidatus Omnitrophota bacterium]
MKCIRGFKYRGNLRLISVFEEIILNFLNENDIRTCSADLIVPVPLHPVRLYRRGYNQSELISNILSKHLSIPVSRHALVKTKNTVPQMGLPRKRRVKNLKNSFAVVDRLNLLGRSVMLVDDIMTTGATLDTCAQELTRSGVTALYGFTLARTM